MLKRMDMKIFLILHSKHETVHLFPIFQCSAGQAMNMMYEMLYESPTKIMILGPGCSTEAEVLAQATPAWNITHVCNCKHTSF